MSEGRPFPSALWIPVRLKMALYFTTGYVGKLPNTTSGWMKEDTDLTGYLCVALCSLLMPWFMSWHAIALFFSWDRKTKERLQYLAMTLARKIAKLLQCLFSVPCCSSESRSLHSTLRHNMMMRGGHFICWDSQSGPCYNCSKASNIKKNKF